MCVIGDDLYVIEFKCLGYCSLETQITVCNCVFICMYADYMFMSHSNAVVVLTYTDGSSVAVLTAVRDGFKQPFH